MPGGLHRAGPEGMTAPHPVVPSVIPQLDPAGQVLRRELAAAGELGLETLIEHLGLQGFHLGRGRLDRPQIGRGLLQQAPQLLAGGEQALDVRPGRRALRLSSPYYAPFVPFVSSEWTLGPGGPPVGRLVSSNLVEAAWRGQAAVSWDSHAT